MSRSKWLCGFAFYFPESSILRVSLEQPLRNVSHHGRTSHTSYHIEAIKHFLFPRGRFRFGSQGASKVGEVMVRPANNNCLTAKRLIRKDAPCQQSIVFCEERSLHW